MKHPALTCLAVLLALVATGRQRASAQLAAPKTHGPPAARTPASNANSPGTSGAGGAGSAAVPATTPAASRKTYYIEIVIFRAQVALGSPEDWQAETNMARTVSGAEAANGSSQTARLLRLVPRSQYRLSSLAATLRSSHTYKVVAHAAWKQTASSWGNDAGFTLRQLRINVPGLTGEVYFERGQYLHLGMQLDYTIAHPPAGLGANPGTTFVLNEIRRVRFYQRNYYDNPAFGVIALVLPVGRGSRPPGR